MYKSDTTQCENAESEDDVYELESDNDDANCVLVEFIVNGFSLLSYIY